MDTGDVDAINDLPRGKTHPTRQTGDGPGEEQKEWKPDSFVGSLGVLGTAAFVLRGLQRRAML
jgi:hypothetical protein